jgi:hypothetical protein
MAQFYRHTCGHTSLRGLSGQGEKAIDGLCPACLEARIGQVIPFARHGAPPQGASRNHRDGSAEAGVSVYEIVDGEIQYCGWSFEIEKRPLYTGTGEIVGWGSDGEPLVKILTIKKAKKA